MHSPVIAFDPGGTTGFAVLSGDDRILFTQALVIDALDGFVEFMSLKFSQPTHWIDIVIEVGPQFEHHSPITRRVEVKLREAFPKAHLIQPSEWKSHPAAHKLRLRPGMTVHEKDAVRLAYWFKRSIDDATKDSAVPNSKRQGRVSN